MTFLCTACVPDAEGKFRRKCSRCGKGWFSLRCKHHPTQLPCPYCSAKFRPASLEPKS